MSNLEWLEQTNTAITSEKAEKYFMAWGRTEYPEWGEAIDKTTSVGLDYDIEFSDKDIKVEVRGCRGNIESLQMTKREWGKARNIGDLYCLAIVSRLDSNPKVNLIFDPYGRLQNDVDKHERIQITYVIPDTQSPPTLITSVRKNTVQSSFGLTVERKRTMNKRLSV